MTSGLLASRSGSTGTSWMLVGAALLATLLAIPAASLARRHGWLPAPAELRRLSPGERRTVARSVQRGEPVDDPALVDVAVAHARVVASRLARFESQNWVNLYRALGGLFALLAVWSAFERDYANLTLQSALAVMCTANPFLVRRQYGRALSAIERNGRMASGDEQRADAPPPPTLRDQVSPDGHQTAPGAT